MRYCCIGKNDEDKTELHLLPAQMTFWTGTKEKHQRPCSFSPYVRLLQIAARSETEATGGSHKNQTMAKQEKNKSSKADGINKSRTYQALPEVSL